MVAHAERYFKILQKLLKGDDQMQHYWLTCKKPKLQNSNFTQTNSTILCPEALKQEGCTAYIHCCRNAE